MTVIPVPTVLPKYKGNGTANSPTNLQISKFNEEEEEELTTHFSADSEVALGWKAGWSLTAL